MDFVRRATRYNLTLPVRLRDAAGVTRDMSTSGIFFETEKALSIGDTVDLSADFENTTIQYEGRVVRVEKIEDRFGIAVALTSYRFS